METGRLTCGAFHNDCVMSTRTLNKALLQLFFQDSRMVSSIRDGPWSPALHQHHHRFRWSTARRPIGEKEKQAETLHLPQISAPVELKPDDFGVNQRPSAAIAS